MANKIKQTTSGACANFKACNLLRSDAHNRRTGRITNPNIDLNLTHRNISWVAPEISDLRAYDRQIRADYVSFPRQRRQNGKEIIYHRPLPKKGRTKASPIMELILLLPEANPKKEDLVKQFIQRIGTKYGLRCIRYFIHLDEYFKDPDLNKIRFNYHAHIVWDTYDWQAHRIIHLHKPELREIQDIATLITGMPRGTDARLTKKHHLDPPAYKVKKERERAERLERENNERERILKEREADVEKVYDNCVKDGLELVKLFDDNVSQPGVQQLLEPKRPIRNRLMAICSNPKPASGVISKVVDELRALINELREALQSIAEKIHLNISGALKNNKIFSFFASSSDITNLKTNTELTTELDDVKTKLQATQAQMELERSLAKRAGVEIDKDVVLMQVRTLLGGFVFQGTCTAEDLIMGKIKIIKAGHKGYDYDIKYDFKENELKYRVHYSEFQKQDIWASSVEEADRIHNKQLEMRYFTKHHSEKRELKKVGEKKKK